ncbi:hypothetical protein CEXT_320161 [Caerostris extrusa]|uniref:Uncharacterized protein n=1 Tax=Caerostris extrusa TaxID=172846 RepID=A0AAV4WZ55_CAEEX|nr:hypothetical protein CEXT_320161 [Caerostris extrusa]
MGIESWKVWLFCALSIPKPLRLRGLVGTDNGWSDSNAKLEVLILSAVLFGQLSISGWGRGVITLALIIRLL